MRRFIMLAMLALVLYNVPVSVSANEEVKKQMEDILEDKEQEEKSDLTKVKKELQAFLKEHQDAKTDSVSEDDKSSLGNEKYKYDRAYCVQSVEMFMVTEYYKHNKKMDDLIFDDYKWHVPYVASNGQEGVAVLIEDGNKFEWVSETDNETREVIIPEEEQIISIVKKHLDTKNTIKDVKYLYHDLYHLNMVYIKCDKESYIIPYAEFPEMINAEAGKVKLKNGQLYSIEDFMETMNTLFDEQNWKNIGEDEVGAGLPYRQPHTMRIVVVTVCLMVVITLFVVHKYRKQNRNEDRVLS